MITSIRSQSLKEKGSFFKHLRGSEPVWGGGGAGWGGVSEPFSESGAEKTKVVANDEYYKVPNFKEDPSTGSAPAPLGSAWLRPLLPPPTEPSKLKL